MGLNFVFNLKKSSVQLLLLIVAINISRGSLQLHGTNFAIPDKAEKHLV